MTPILIEDDARIIAPARAFHKRLVEKQQHVTGRPLIVVQIFDALRGLNRRGASILLVEQNARMALRLARRGYVLSNGEVTLSGPADALLTDRRIQEAYLGG
jgi:ABC-type branched-subunit amino acid transport system ATPase component